LLSNEWKSIGYAIASIPTPGPQGAIGFIQIGVAAAIRSGDNSQQVGRRLMPPIIPEAWDWKVEAKARLDTYLDCDCNGFSKCQFHFGQEPQWEKEDMQAAQITKLEQIPDGLRGIVGPPREQDMKRIILPN